MSRDVGFFMFMVLLIAPPQCHLMADGTPVDQVSPYQHAIMSKNDVNVTALWIETDDDDNTIVIYGNESEESGWTAMGADKIYISKYGSDGVLMWRLLITDRIWAFEVTDVRIDTANDIHLMSRTYGQCGVELPRFQYYKISSQGELLIYRYYTGTLCHMELYDDSTACYLYEPAQWGTYFWLGGSFLDGLRPSNITIRFVRAYDENDDIVEVNMTFVPRGFFLEDPDTLIIFAERMWRYNLSGEIIAISDHIGSYLPLGYPLIWDNYVLFSDHYKVRLYILSDDLTSIVAKRDLLIHDNRTSKYHTSVRIRAC